LEFVNDWDTLTSKIVNKSGLEVFIERFKLFVVNKFSNLLQEQEHGLPLVRGSDLANTEVTLDGIWVPIFCTESDWRLYWEFTAEIT